VYGINNSRNDNAMKYVQQYHPEIQATIDSIETQISRVFNNGELYHGIGFKRVSDTALSTTTPVERPFPCTYVNPDKSVECDQSFTCDKYLQQHLARTHKPPTFKCELDNCNQLFTREEGRRTHQAKRHNSDGTLKPAATVKWSAADDKLMLKLRSEGMSFADIAPRLTNRSESAVKSRHIRLTEAKIDPKDREPKKKIGWSAAEKKKLLK
jgi:hypothetical protein